MTTEEKTDLQQLKGILGQFDTETIVSAVREIGITAHPPVTVATPGLLGRFWAEPSPISDIGTCAITWKCKDLYSRGNNDRGELEEQKKKAGGKEFQYETAKISLESELASNCKCTEGVCKGIIKIGLKVRISPPTGGKAVAAAANYAVMCGGEPPAPPEGVDAVVRREDMPDFNKAVDKQKFSPDGDDYIAQAECEIPCTPGKYRRRFWIVPENSLVWVDYQIRLTESDCTITPAVDVGFYEILAGQKLLGHDIELSKVIHKGPNKDGAQLKREESSNFMRLVKRECDLGTPFPKKAF